MWFQSDSIITWSTHFCYFLSSFLTREESYSKFHKKVTTGCPGCSRHCHAPAPTNNPHWEIAHANSMLITTAHCSPLSPKKQKRERERERKGPAIFEWSKIRKEENKLLATPKLEILLLDIKVTESKKEKKSDGSEWTFTHLPSMQDGWYKDRKHFFILIPSLS